MTTLVWILVKTCVGATQRLKVASSAERDAFVGSSECQKAGSLHIHGHLFVQCLHQHGSMQDIFETTRQNGGENIVQGYLKYKAHVCDESYASVEGWEPERRKEREDAWPEYKNSIYKYRDLTISHKKYVARHSENVVGRCGADKRVLKRVLKQEGLAWLKQFTAHKQLVQEHKQHHIHLVSADGKKRLPLTCCRRRDKPKECCGGFPKDVQILKEERAVVVCPGLAKKMKLATKGRRNALGSISGPRNEGNVSGTHGAWAVALGDNTDVQLPYRLPITRGTHSEFCQDENCVGDAADETLMHAAQMAQDAQVGYSTDYSNKRSASSTNECKEYQKGHRELGSELKGESIGYCGRRHTQRIMSDLYAKGIVRGAVEATNLCVHGTNCDGTAAEMINENDENDEDRNCKLVNWVGGMSR